MDAVWKPTKIPIPDIVLSLRLLRINSALSKKEEEEQVGGGRGGERSCKSRCHFCLIKNSFRTKEQNILKRALQNSILEGWGKSCWHSPDLLGIKWKEISLAIFFIDCHYYVYMLVFLHCVFWKTTSIFSMASAEGCRTLCAHIL